MLNTFSFYALMLLVVGVPFYFQERVRSFAKTTDSLSLINSLSAKLSAFIILSLYVMSFLSFQAKNAAYSKVGFCSCIFSFFLLYSFRGKVISQIRDIPANPKERFQRSLRSLGAMSLIYGIYFATVHYLIPVAGTLPAIGVALIFITYSAPLFVRVWMPTQRMHPSEMKSEIMQVFANANNPVHEVYLIDTDRFKSYNALVCGPKFGFGDFKRSVFITKNLFEIMEPEEIKAVMCHEAAHFKLHHIFKRACMSMVAMIVAMLFVAIPITFISVLFKLSVDKNFGFLICTTVATIVVQLTFLFRVIRKQEFEADLEALNIGATTASISSALEKITVLNGGSRKKEDWISRFMSGSAHPSLEERLNAIQTRILPESSKILPPWKYTVSYASVVLVLGTLTLFNFDSNRANRTVASVTTDHSGQILPTAEDRLQSANEDDE